MSAMIECDSCKKKMYADSRSEKGAYHEIWIDRSDSVHICEDCRMKILKEFFPDLYEYELSLQEE